MATTRLLRSPTLRSELALIPVVLGCACQPAPAPRVIGQAARPNVPPKVSATPRPAAGSEGECTDGVDNDGDGRIDWQFDTGCYGPRDRTETAGPREAEDGFSTWDPGPESRVVYVSLDGHDSADGATPERAVRSLRRARKLIRDGAHDFLLLRRGDVWKNESLEGFVSGRDRSRPVVVGSYGDSRSLPRVELDRPFIDHGGRERSFVALVDLHLVSHERDPARPEFTGVGPPLLRFVGGGEGLLVEGCHVERGEIVVQGRPPSKYVDVEIRRTTIRDAYQAGSCLPGNPEGNPEVRSSGIFSKRVESLLLEENLLDHNGWSDEVESACATMYNHNAYLNASGLVVRGNVFARASSMHVKLKADEPGGMRGVTIEDNTFVEGEIGVSIGGNSSEPARFVDGVIRNNVFFALGRSRPTGRDIAWGVEVKDNVRLRVVDNLFLGSPSLARGTAVRIVGDSQEDVVVSGNEFRWRGGPALWVERHPAHAGVRIAGNTVSNPDGDACLVQQRGGFVGYSYADNRYFSTGPSAQWFCVASGPAPLTSWVAASGESGAIALPEEPPFRGRSIESYAENLGLGPSVDALMELGARRSRLNWNASLTANAVNPWLRGD